jgi:GntR family transcriptional regulator
VLKAYRDLDREGLVEGRRGIGTFVAEDVAPLPPGDVQDLRSGLEGWIARARGAGLDDDAMAALFMDTLRPPAIRSVA